MDKTNETDQPVAYPPVQEKLLVWKLWTVIAAVSLGSAITILMRLFQYGRPDADQTLNSLIVLLTATLSGWLSWWLLITRRRMLTKLRGALAGAFTGLCSYFLIFQVTNLVYGAALPEFFGASLGTRIASGFILSIITLIFSGWFSLPLLAGVGMVLARVQMATFPNLEHRLALPMRGIGTRWRSFSRDHPMLQMFFAVLFSGGVILILLGGWIWTRPLRVDDLRTEGKALNDYAESIGALRAMLEAEAADPNLNPECASQLIEQGRRTTKVIVFYHGFTNCPAQFIPLAEQFALRGYNVYIPRIPYHGYANRMTPALAQLSAEELVRFADESIDLAHGLGDSITVVGLSAGGNIAGWIAQERTDVAQVTLIAPMFHVHGLPPFSIRPVASTILAFPNFYLWWDANRREDALGPAYAYPRYPIRAIGELLRLSFAVQDMSALTPPAVGEILIVSNAADNAVSISATNAMANAWMRNGAAVRRFVFPADLQLNHDVIDINQPAQQVDRVYPMLITLIEEGRQPDG